MAKGDFVEVRAFSGEVGRIEATRIGRRLQLSYRTRAKLVWLDVEEMTRTGRPTGTSMQVRLDQIVTVTTNRAPADVKESVHAKQARQAATGTRRHARAADSEGPATT